MRRGTFVLGSILLFSGCIGPTESGHCDRARDCQECSRRAGCGWCGASNTCFPGSSIGPNVASACDAASWSFGTCGTAEDYCPSRSNCSECLGVSYCAWCPSAGGCIPRADEASCPDSVGSAVMCECLGPGACEQPPSSTCVNDHTLRTYRYPGTCGVNGCEYRSNDRNCPNCPACDPCAGVSCNAPPSPADCFTGTCSDGACQYVFNEGASCTQNRPSDSCYPSSGFCHQGACVYVRRTSGWCDDGDACTVNDACTASGCSGTPKICNNPPSTNGCYASTGTCSNGTCTYAFNDGVACDGGGPPSSNGCYGSMGTCSSGACTYPFNNGATCTGTPPSPAACYAATGTCADGFCTFDYADGAACDDGDFCTVNDTCSSGTCVSGSARTCGTPPAPTICYQATGTCSSSSSSCRYPYNNGVHCTYSPPANACNAANTRVFAYDDTTGTCGSGSCRYDRVAVDCPYGCSSGACQSGTCMSGAWTLTPLPSAASMTIAPSGDLHLVLNSRFADLSRPAGGAWNYSVVRSGPSSIRGSSVAVDATGRVHIAYLPDTTHLDYATRAPGGSWSTTPVDTSGNEIESPSIAVDSSGGVHIAYHDYTNGDLKYAYMAPGGAWSTETVDSPGSVGFSPSISVDSSDGVHISHIDGTNLNLKYAYRPAGGAWTLSIVDGTNLVGGGTGLALDSSDGVHIAYGHASANELWHAYQPAGGSWSTSVVDTYYFGSSGGAAIALDGSDNIYIAFLRNVSTPTLEYAYRPAAGGRWSFTAVDGSTNTSNVFWLSLDLQGGVDLVFYDEGLTEHVFARQCP